LELLIPITINATKQDNIYSSIVKRGGIKEISDTLSSKRKKKGGLVRGVK